jgi:membrane fusion protein (multidrug efflux system)
VSNDFPANEQPATSSRFRQLSTVARVMVIMGAVIVLGLLIWFISWWTTGRFLQSTNDAYLQADQVIAAPKIQGYVSEVFVLDNQEVKAGQPLVHIDPRQYEAVLKQAQATIDAREADVKRALAALSEQHAMTQQADAQLSNARSDAAFAGLEVERYGPLAESGADTQEHLAKLRNDHQQALGAMRASSAASLASQKSVASGEAQLAQARAQLEAAKESAREAQLDFDDTLVKSSIDGRIGDRTVRVGQFVQPGTRMMSVVPTHDIYLRANFKETQIKLMRVGQPAEIHVDALPDLDVRGTVESFSPGTGAQFALLPPENATGNFTKIVQRVPVRIRVQASDAVRKLLLPGLSVNVQVDTRGARAEMKRLQSEQS